MSVVKITIDQVKDYIKYFDNISEKIKAKKEKELNEIYEKNNPIMKGFFVKRLVNYSFTEFINKFINPMDTPDMGLTCNIINVYDRNATIENILIKMKRTFNNMIATNTSEVTLSDTEFDVLSMLLELNN